MANLKNFLNRNVQPNKKFNLYHEFARLVVIGDVTPLIVENLHLKMKGNINFAGFRFENKMVEIIMDNENPNGRCTLILDRTRLENVPYKTRGNDLVIEPVNFPLNEIVLQPGDREWSWFGIKYSNHWFGFFGTWPADKQIAIEDVEAAPQQMQEPVS